MFGKKFDFIYDDSGRIISICGDATGHGTSSGMMVSIIKSGLNGLPSLSTDKVLYELNNIVKKIDLGTLKMSLNICEIKNGSITLSSAAMPPIYLYNSKSKKTEEILIRGLPLGGLKNETFDIQKKKFNKGDVLILGACLIYAIYTIFLRNKPNVPGMVMFAVIAVSAMLASLPFAFFEFLSASTVWPTHQGWIVVLFVVIFPSFLSLSSHSDKKSLPSRNSEIKFIMI